MFKLLKINEVVKNKKLLTTILKKYLREIDKLFNLKSENIYTPDSNNMKFNLELRFIPIEYNNKILKLLNKCKNEMNKNDIVMNFKENLKYVIKVVELSII